MASGRTSVTELQLAFEAVCEIIGNCDNSRLLLSDLHKVMGANKMSYSKYGNEMQISRHRGKRPVISHKNTSVSGMCDNLFSKGEVDKKRILEAAAGIIRADIKAENCFVPSDNSLNDTAVNIPESLKSFLRNVISTVKTGDEDRLTIKRDSIAHIIVSAVRQNFEEMEPLDRGHLLEESSCIKDMSDLIESVNIKVEPDFLDPSSTFQNPINNEENDALKRNDSTIAVLPSSEKQTCKMEPLDCGHLLDESVLHMSDLIEFQDIKIEPDSPDPSCTLQESIVKEESDAQKENDNSIAMLPSSEKHRTSVNLEIKLESEDLRNREHEPTNSTSKRFLHAEPKETINEQDIKNRTANISTTNNPSPLNPSENPHSCDICTRVSASKINPISHTEAQLHSCSCKTLQKSQSNFFAKQKTFDKDSFSKKAFRKKSAKNRQTGEKPFECSVCGKTFAPKTNMKNHMLTHTGQKPYECSFCGRAFAQRGNMRTHMLIHTMEKTHSCSICGKAFTRQLFVKQHMLTHTGEKSHGCSVCGKTFRRKDSVKQHMLTHTGAKTHECGVCKRMFARKTDLSNHMMTHTGEKTHACGFCNKAFARKTDLKTHRLTHSDEKPHECSVCERAFRTKLTMRSHMLVHTGQKPFECSVCGRRFARKTNMKTHLARVHAG